MYSTSDFRKGLKVKFKGDPYVIIYFLHVKPGKGGA
jgi:elongation factor P